MVALDELPAGADDVNGHGPRHAAARSAGVRLHAGRHASHPDAPMANDGEEAIGSMGNDTPLAVLSDRPQLLYNYFKQLFAQVTNPPLDAIREEIGDLADHHVGSRGQPARAETPEQCRQLRLDQPILDQQRPGEAQAARRLARLQVGRTLLDALPARPTGPTGWSGGCDELCARGRRRRSTTARPILILSDRGVNDDMAPIPALLATGGLHHHLVREGTRTRCGLVIETGEPARCITSPCSSATGPARSIRTWPSRRSTTCIAEGYIARVDSRSRSRHKNYIKAIEQGLVKVMSKMGICTMQSYRGAQIFEAIGLNERIRRRVFHLDPQPHRGRRPRGQSPKNRCAATSTPIPRADVPAIARSGRRRPISVASRGRSTTCSTPRPIAKLQHATRINSRDGYSSNTAS